MGNKYAVVKVCAEGVNPEVHTFNDKKEAREFLKQLWKTEKEDLEKTYNTEFDVSDTWCDADGDCARLTWEEDDWTYYQVVDVKNAMENSYMPFDIDDTVYYMKKESEVGGHIGYKVIKCVCYGYYNFGNGWKMKLRTNRNKFKFAEYDISITDVGHKVFYNKADIKDRLKDINGFILEE